MADFQHWRGVGHAPRFSRMVAHAAVAVEEAKNALYAALKAGYPADSRVYVIHHRGCFEGTVAGWDTYGCRVHVKNSITGKVSKWWAAHVQLQEHTPDGTDGVKDLHQQTKSATVPDGGGA